MYNREKAQEFIEEEFRYWQLEKLELENDIQLGNSKLVSIDNEISELKEKMGKDDYAFHSTNFDDDLAIKLETLNKTKEEILSEDIAYKDRLKLIEQKIENLDHIINDDDLQDNDSTTEISKDILRSIEFERERISRDIHDTVIQTLTALSYKDEFIIKLIEQDAKRAKLELQSRRTALKDCINELREIISNLRMGQVKDLGFEAACNQCISKLKDSSDIIFNYSFIGDDNVDDIIAISILRIINELTSNSIKHSKCSKVDISIKKTNNEIVLKHKDNGIGFDFDNQRHVKYNKTGFGMVMLRERVELLKGVISFSNHKGSSFTITIPIK